MEVEKPIGKLDMNMIERNLVQLEGPFKEPTVSEFTAKCEKIITRYAKKWYHSRAQPYATNSEIRYNYYAEINDSLVI